MSSEADKALERLGDISQLDGALQRKLKQMAQEIPEPQNKRILNNGMTVWYHHQEQAPYMSVKLTIEPHDVVASKKEKEQYVGLGFLFAHLLSRSDHESQSVLSDLKKRDYNLFVHASGSQIELESPYVQNDKLQDILAVYDEKLHMQDAHKWVDYCKNQLMNVSTSLKWRLYDINTDSFDAFTQHIVNPSYMTLTVTGSLPPDQAWKKIENSPLAKRPMTNVPLPILSKRPADVENSQVFPYENKGR